MAGTHRPEGVVGALDIVVLGVLLVSAALGAWRGLIVEVMSLLSWAAAFLLAYRFGGELAPHLANWLSSPTAQMVAGYVGVFIVVLAVAGVLTWLLSRLVRGTGLTGTDRMLGFGFGVVRGVAICAALTLAAGLTPLTSEPWWRASHSAAPLERVAVWMRARLPDSLASAIHYAGDPAALMLPAPVSPLEVPPKG